MQGTPESAAVGPAGISGSTQEWVELINTVIQSGLYNYQGCKFQTGHAFNIPLLDSLLVNYHDKHITKFLQHGRPIPRDETVQLEKGEITRGPLNSRNVLISTLIRNFPWEP